MTRQSTKLKDLIKSYFSLGLQQYELRAVLGVLHNIFISERHLRRLLKKFGLYRRKHTSDIQQVVQFLERQIQTSGQLHGYKWMHLRCLQNNLVTSQETVRILLQILDPRGVQIRSRRRLRRRRYSNKGPNYLWHMDCYDKLKPYGICISGCIDGFSRHIMWLKAGKNSNCPKIIAGHYMNVVTAIGGCPLRLRADMGTENCNVEQLQIFLRRRPVVHDINNPLSPFLYGTSMANQRIEAWWAILRQHQSQFWMNLFQQLKDDDLFNGTLIDKALIQLCFLKIIQDDLDTVVNEWNSHRISISRNATACRGRPFMLYHMPEGYDAEDYLCVASNEDIQACNEECVFADNECICDEDVYELALLIMEEKELQFEVDVHRAINLYVTLRNEFIRLL